MIRIHFINDYDPFREALRKILSRADYSVLEEMQ